VQILRGLREALADPTVSPEEPAFRSLLIACMEVLISPSGPIVACVSTAPDIRYSWALVSDKRHTNVSHGSASAVSTPPVRLAALLTWPHKLYQLLCQSFRLYSHGRKQCGVSSREIPAVWHASLIRLRAVADHNAAGRPFFPPAPLLLPRLHVGQPSIDVQEELRSDNAR
jgi:hypothetical protein